ncbi:cytochrome c-type biogenesis protein [Pararhizobium mangrovi]|uniref:cytochrome c-type biogenesis protein n=1 Tax=Pararhizobium mangrovi TaxID=2590452 RepID=UPI0038B3349B
MLAVIALIAVVFAAVTPALAVDPGEMLANPRLEERARAISAQLRCLVCQNESIDESNADLAHDLRLLVRRRLKEGETNRQVIDYIVSRYGEFVLLKPRFEAKTVFLWATPMVVFLCGAGAMVLFARRRHDDPGAQRLNAEERVALENLLERREGDVSG